MSTNPINNAFSGFTGKNVRSQSAKGMKNTGLMEAMKKAQEDTEEKKTETTEKPQNTQSQISVEKTETAPVLSEKAQAYLETLKEKFGDVNFVVGDGTVTDASANGKKFNCFISADLLEKMAADEDYAKKYEGVISDAIEQVEDLRQQVEEKGLGKFVKSFNITITEDGESIFTVMLKDGVRDLNGKKGTEEKPNSVSSATIDGILDYLDKLNERLTKFDAFDNGAEGVKRAVNASRGRQDGFDINAMLGDRKANTANAHSNKNKDGFRSVDK
ncbi:MAG: DUF6033 family protein [Oscillospiraceae bacterium]|nr:DUF6033 family protein [Oscillospiraceae bacterium]